MTPTDPQGAEGRETRWRTVVVDPPWQPSMANINGEAEKASPSRHYATMPLADIIALRPQFAEQAHLYVWCLSQHIDWGFEVAKAWGGVPLTTLTWKKPGLGVGRFRCNTEHVVVARIGDRIGNPFGAGGRHSQATAGTCFEWPRGRHSAKPDEFFSLVERISPAPRLEMYARRPRAGWAVWGNEVETATYITRTRVREGRL